MHCVLLVLQKKKQNKSVKNYILYRQLLVSEQKQVLYFNDMVLLQKIHMFFINT